MAKYKPLLLDLFCGAGGAGMGYHRAGFEVVGVDIAPQPSYPFWFVRADALWFAEKYGHMFDVIHASPPCQHYSNSTPIENRNNHPDLIPETQRILRGLNKPYVIENVPGARKLMDSPLRLCGTMFPGLNVIRHRYFETNPQIYFAPMVCHHWKPTVRQGYAPIDPTQEFHSVTGHFSGTELGKEAMGIDWVKNRYELAQAIPPAYTEYLGKRLLDLMEN